MQFGRSWDSNCVKMITMELTQSQLKIFNEALQKARVDLGTAEERKRAIVNEELEINRELANIQNLIDALEILLGETTEIEVFKRNKKRKAEHGN